MHKIISQARKGNRKWLRKPHIPWGKLACGASKQCIKSLSKPSPTNWLHATPYVGGHTQRPGLGRAGPGLALHPGPARKCDRPGPSPAAPHGVSQACVCVCVVHGNRKTFRGRTEQSGGGSARGRPPSAPTLFCLPAISSFLQGTGGASVRPPKPPLASYRCG